MCTQDLIFLESFQMIGWIASMYSSWLSLDKRNWWLIFFCSFLDWAAWWYTCMRIARGRESLLNNCILTINKIDWIRVNYSMVWATNLKVVCDQIDWTTLHHSMTSTLGLISKRTSTSCLLHSWISTSSCWVHLRAATWLLISASVRLSIRLATVLTLDLALPSKI